MDLKGAIKCIKDDKSFILEAKRRVDDHCPDADFTWLYDKTGGEPAKYREICVDGRRYPTKAFGFLVSQLAGNTQTLIGAPSCTTDAVAKPLEHHGYYDFTRKSGKGGKLKLKLSPQQEDQIAKSYYQILARPNQAKFRRALLEEYMGCCAVTGNKVQGCLEAAHVKPVCFSGEDTPDNGLLLRSDIHKLFDRHDVAIDPSSFTVHFSPACLVYYGDYEGRSVMRSPNGPSESVFKDRWDIFCGKRKLG